MSTEIGNAALRVTEALQPVFEQCVVRACQKLAAYCESPIEVMLGSALAMALNLSRPGFVQLITPGEPAQADKNTCALCPQYRWQNYRFDFAIIFKTVTVLIECDGHDFHERTKEQAAHDRQKDRVAQEAGFAILRFTGSEIYRDAGWCAGQIASFLSKALERAEKT